MVYSITLKKRVIFGVRITMELKQMIISERADTLRHFGKLSAAQAQRTA